jgi:hypothetical protein
MGEWGKSKSVSEYSTVLVLVLRVNTDSEALGSGGAARLPPLELKYGRYCIEYSKYNYKGDIGHSVSSTQLDHMPLGPRLLVAPAQRSQEPASQCG